LSAIGFKETDTPSPLPTPDKGIIKQYDKQRDFPAIEGASHLGVHLRFGTISIRQLAKQATSLNETFLNETARKRCLETYKKALDR